MCRNVSGECGCPGGGGGGGTDALTLQGATWQSPLGIGTIAPAAGNFTTSSITTATITTANVTQLNATNINVSSLTANQFVATDGSKNLVSTTVTGTITATPSTLVQRNSNADIYTNNFVPNVTLVTTATGTTTLTISSAYSVFVTGTLNENIKMPQANLYSVIGATFEINNNSTGTLSLLNFGSGAIGSIPPGGFTKLVLSDIGTANGIWDIHCYIAAGATWGTTGLVATTKLTTTSTTNATSAVTGSIQTLGGCGIDKDLWVTGNIYMAGVLLPTVQNRVTLWMDDSIVTVGNALSFLATSTVPYNWRVFQSAAAINDSFYQTFVLKPGTYTMNVIGQQDTNKAIQTWYIDGVSQGTMDWYRASSLNLLMTMSVTVVGAGVHTLTSTALSKNASSTAYQIFINKMSIF